MSSGAVAAAACESKSKEPGKGSKMLKSMFKGLAKFFKVLIIGDEETAKSIVFADMSEEENDEDVRIYGED